MPGLSEKLVTEFEDLLRQRPYQQYGQASKPERDRLLAQKKALVKPHHIKGISLIPGAPEDFFSNEQLFDLQSDKEFAKKLIRMRTGKSPTEQQIDDLQNRIKATYPNLREIIEPVYESNWGEKFYKTTKALADDPNNLKPFVDFVLKNPDVSPNPTQRKDLVTAANIIKTSGYKINDQTRPFVDAFRDLANTHTQQTLAAAETLRADPRVSEIFGEQLTPDKALAIKLQQIPDSILKRLQNEQREREHESAENVRLDVDLGNQIANLVQNTQRIAPLNEVHAQAKQLVNKGIGSDTLATARDKLAAAEQMDIPGEIAPYLQAANKPTQELIQEFMTNYGPVIEGFRQEAAKDFLEHDIPKINSQFASKGAFFSGAREAALNKAKADKEARIEREISKLMTHGHEQAMKHTHTHREGKLKSAEIAGNARKSQKEALHNAAESLRANAQVEQAANLSNVGVLSNIARTEQEQAQHEIDTRMAEHREEQQRPFVELGIKSALGSGHPLPPFYSSPMGINHPPPNVYGGISNALGLAAGLHKTGYSHEAPLKKGGHVRRKYAKGGPIARHAAEWQQMGQHMQGTPSAQIADESMREAQAMRHHRVDPQGAYLMALTSHQMANPGKPMMQTFGEGTQKAYDAFNAAKAYNVDSKTKYINLINAIDKSRMEGQTLLANYHLKKSHHEETQRYHNMANAESMRHHDLMNERQTQQPLKRSATEINLEEEAKQKLLKSSKMKDEIKYLGKLIKNTNTGPRWGFVKSHLPTTETDNQIRVLTNSIIMDVHQGMKNIPRSEAFMERLESTKPNTRNHYSANKLSVNMMNKGADIVNKNAISTLKSLGWTPEKIQEFLEEEKSKETGEGVEGSPSPENLESEPANDNEYTWMKFPGESKEIEVANDDVAKALERGAQIV